MRGGLWLILISLVLFAVFGSFLGGFNFHGSYWPVLLIALGVLSLERALFRSERAPRRVVPVQPDPPGPAGADGDRPAAK